MAHQALDAMLAAWRVNTAPIFHRLEAAFNASTILVSIPAVKNLRRAYLLLRDVVHLMPLATPRSLGREDHQYILRRLIGFVSLCAGVTLEVTNSSLEAIRFLELGRSVTNGQLLDLPQ